MKGPRDPRVPISRKWTTMLQWSSSDEEGGQEPGEGGFPEFEEELAARNSRGARKVYDGPGRKEAAGGGKIGGGGVHPLGDGGFEDLGVVEDFSPYGTSDRIWQDTLDFDEEDPGELSAARSPWEEGKVRPGAAGRITSAGWRGEPWEAAEVPSGRCGGVGFAPPRRRCPGGTTSGPVRYATV
ncbi:hypothetical protein NDU88_000379 [Pleurodeles waltl]|uniref:Uncharacterized protein n=1 Tax=Pleurodeles waltl TaxID=8319 RepID=A0AAV7UPU6_PLEWA|nr:hypothetical protein NDU88_000379 [Pleurodeles waltl]